ncbi:helix-turn-helix domain-containing protein [Streptomyces sp. NPDC018045]|uniref:helix-turn-helix domain-containing protein n=1 Tax=Streptomyces sp. NPDC018045 TaxID=3365037 RepID=UPI003794EB75
MTAADTCRQCGKGLTYAGRGRRRLYCSRACQRRKRTPGKDIQTGQERYEVLQTVHRITGTLLDAEYTAAPDPGQNLPRSARARKHLEIYDALAVLQMRAEGVSWETIGQAAGISGSTASRKWSRASVESKLQRFKALAAADPPEPAGPAAVPRQRGADGAPPGRQPPGDEESGGAGGLSSVQQFANALSHLQRGSTKPVRDIAQNARISASYVSRVLSGERVPSWSVARRITLACDGDPAALRTLWRAARGVTPSAKITSEDAVGALHAALRGLHLSAGRPDPYLLHTQCQGSLTEGQITDVFHGQYLPDWPALGRLVLALDGRPDTLRPLWNAANPTPPSLAPARNRRLVGLPASAFG